MSTTYRQQEFYAELQKMLREANAKGQPRVCILSEKLHDRVVTIVVTKNDKRMPMACNAMWKLKKQQGIKAKVIFEPPSGQSNKLKIEFDTAAI